MNADKQEKVLSSFVEIANRLVLLDIPPYDEVRGYATFNKKEIKKFKDCFEKLKKYGVPLKDILK